MLIQSVKFLSCILEEFDINLGTILAEIFLSPSRQILRLFLKLDHCPRLPHLLRIHYSPTTKHETLCMTGYSESIDE
jgi:hypothetical protein